MTVDTSAITNEAERRWQAVLARDADCDGEFVFAVTSTGIFCRPSCPARRPLRQNVRFFDLPRDASAQGFRACRRCRPDELSQEQRHSAMVEAACRRIKEAEIEPGLAELARDAGLSPAHFQKTFKARTGLSPKRYAMAHRDEALRRELGHGRSVTEAIHGSGHESPSRVYERAVATLGMTPSAYRKGGAGQTIWYAIGRCELGAVLVAGTALGLCAVSFGESEADLVAGLETRFASARLQRAGEEVSALVARVVAEIERPSGAAELPLDIQGTAFQKQVWDALRAIPPGMTASYTEVARRIGRANATRAVANACGANPLAVMVPCHRVVRGDGALGGYRWGVARKKALLEREKER